MYLKEMMNGIINGGKTLREIANPKNNIFICKIHCYKYQLIKSMYKIITSLYLKKSPEA